jgi:DNA-binding CsgD family transcriptional regulator
MTGTTRSDPTARRRRRLALSGLLVLQAGAAAFFVVDIAADIAGAYGLGEGAAHKALEALAVLALIAGLWLTAREIGRLRRRQRRIEAQLRVASGAFLELLEEHFESWGLTPAERDVAMLAIKGLSIAEIAAMRQTREGTVKAQCNAIYGKAGVSGRQQLLSLFIEELMGEALVPAAREAKQPAA